MTRPPSASRARSPAPHAASAGRGSLPALLRASASRAGLPALLGAILMSLAACAACPPGWVERPPQAADALYASGTCGDVFVEADARNIALTRAARRLADELGLNVEPRLSVIFADGRLFVEALTPAGPTSALDGLQLVAEAVCRRTTCVLVRLPRGG